MGNNNYTVIIENNIRKLFEMDLAQRAIALGARHQRGALAFKAFGQQCVLSPGGITLNQSEQSGPMGIVISLYALQANTDESIEMPFKSFKELPDSMPYVGAFVNRTEQALVPAVEKLVGARQQIMDTFDGNDAPTEISGDLTFVVRPLPKIALCYVCYQADEDFPAAVTCLYSQNAHCFLSTDALADLGEYTTKALLTLI